MIGAIYGLIVLFFYEYCYAIPSGLPGQPGFTNAVGIQMYVPILSAKENVNTNII